MAVSPNRPAERQRATFKAPSQTTQQRVAAHCNELDRTVNYDGLVLCEWCLVARSHTISQPGDSGVMVFDDNFHPIAVIWGGGILEASKQWLLRPRQSRSFVKLDSNAAGSRAA